MSAYAIPSMTCRPVSVLEARRRRVLTQSAYTVRLSIEPSLFSVKSPAICRTLHTTARGAGVSSAAARGRRGRRN
jgi:hypothetical protein